MSDAVARAAAIAAKAKDRDADTRARNRSRMPETAAFVDAFRIFGNLPHGRFSENGITVEWGRKAVYGSAVPLSPKQIIRDKRGRIITAAQGQEQPAQGSGRRKGAMRPAGGLPGGVGDAESGAGTRWWD